MLNETLENAKQKIETGDYEGAIQDATHILESNPNYLAAYLLRAEARKKKFDYEGALEDLSRIQKLNATYGHMDKVYGLQAEIKKLQGNYKAALKDLEKALQVNYSYDLAQKMQFYIMQELSSKINSAFSTTTADNSIPYATLESNLLQQTLISPVTEPPVNALSTDMTNLASDVTNNLDNSSYKTLMTDLSHSPQVPSTTTSTVAAIPNKRKRTQKDKPQKQHIIMSNSTSSSPLSPNNNVPAQSNFFLSNNSNATPSLDVTEIVKKTVEMAKTLFTSKEINIIPLIALEEGNTFATEAWRNTPINMIDTVTDAIIQSPEQIAAASITQMANKALTSHCFNEAIALANASISLHPQYPFAYAVRYEARNLVQDYNGAIEDITQFIHFQPQYASGYIKRAYIHFLMKNTEEVIVDINRAIELNPKQSGLVYKLRAAAYQDLGKPGNAFLDQYISYRLQKYHELFSLKKLAAFFILEKHANVMEAKFPFFKGNLNALRKTLISSGITSDTIAAIRAYQGYPTMVPNLFDKLEIYQDKENQANQYFNYSF